MLVPVIALVIWKPQFDPVVVTVFLAVGHRSPTLALGARRERHPAWYSFNFDRDLAYE